MYSPRAESLKTKLIVSCACSIPSTINKFSSCKKLEATSTFCSILCSMKICRMRAWYYRQQTLQERVALITWAKCLDLWCSGCGLCHGCISWLMSVTGNLLLTLEAKISTCIFFSYGTNWENLIKSQNSLSLVITFFILMTDCLIKKWHCKEKLNACHYWGLKS